MTAASLIVFLLAAAPAPAATPAAAPVTEARAFAEYAKLVPADHVLSAAELKRRLDAPGERPLQVVELRPHADWEAGHIPDSTWVPKPHAVIGKFPDPRARLCLVTETDRGAIYIAGVLRRYGYEDVFVLKGGIDAWLAEGFPLNNKVVGDFTVVRPKAAAAAAAK